MLRQMTEESVALIRSKCDMQPEIGLVLGSGLGALGDKLEDACYIPYEEIPHFARSTAPGHKGRLVIGKLAGKTLLCMQGRFHFYEGYSMQQVTYPVRVMKTLGIGALILTNACGGLDPSFHPGELLVISDHINYMGANPLVGPNEDDFGPRFPDMTRVYTPELRTLAKSCAQEQGLTLHEGVYISYSGPNYETPAEIRFFQKAGASVVGMSTVPEAIVANHCGMKLLALSCITNLASGILDVPLSGEEVIVVANEASKRFTGLLEEIIKRM